MSTTKTIHFHVGAHKTATTYMQSRLRSNRERLRKQGVAFIDLWAGGEEEKIYRKKLKRLIEKETPDEQQLSLMSKKLRNIVVNGMEPAGSLVVISYENILGDYDLTRGSAPYPNAVPAIRHLAEAFPGWRLRIFLSIRSLDRFVESSYVQRVFTRRETRKFKQYVKQIDVAGMSWLPVVESIGSVVGIENTFVWTYENFVADEQPIWNALLARSDADAALVRPAKASNHSLSAKGLKYMRSINKVATPADTRKFRAFVKESFGSQLGLKRPKLLGDIRRRQLIANYERDQAELAGKCQLLVEGQMHAPTKHVHDLSRSGPVSPDVGAPR